MATRHRGNGEGSVYRVERPSRTPGNPPAVRWVAQVRVDGVKRRAVAGTEAAAKKALRQMLAAVDAGRGLGDGNATVGQLLDAWASSRLPAKKGRGGERLSPRTVERDLWVVGVLRDDLGSKRMASLKPGDIERAFARRAADGSALATLRRLRSVLGQAYRWAIARGVAVANPVDAIDLPADAAGPATGRALTVDQARQLLAATEGDALRALWVMMLFNGLRPGEALALRWSAVDLERAVLTVRESLKLERGRLVVNEHLKTPRSARTLDMARQVVDALTDHRAHQQAESARLGLPWHEGRLVFSTVNGGPLDPANVRRSLARATERAGLGAWTPNELRHSCASLLSAAGWRLEEVADVLGHTTTRTLERAYRHRVTRSVAAGAGLADVL